MSGAATDARIDAYIAKSAFAKLAKEAKRLTDEGVKPAARPKAVKPALATPDDLAEGKARDWKYERA